jgi:hypothetical protein
MVFEYHREGELMYHEFARKENGDRLVFRQDSR